MVKQEILREFDKVYWDIWNYGDKTTEEMRIGLRAFISDIMNKVMTSLR